VPRRMRATLQAITSDGEIGSAALLPPLVRRGRRRVSFSAGFEGGQGLFWRSVRVIAAHSSCPESGTPALHCSIQSRPPTPAGSSKRRRGGGQ
jgi:hypothetical protein